MTTHKKHNFRYIRRTYHADYALADQYHFRCSCGKTASPFVVKFWS